MSDLDLSKYEGHTEGEWRLDIGTGWIVASRGDRIQVQILVARMRPTCVTDQWEADAHLIADAPLLLAEVRRLRSLEAVCRTVHGGKLWVLADQVEALRHSHARLLEALQLVGRVEKRAGVPYYNHKRMPDPPRPDARDRSSGRGSGGPEMSRESVDWGLRDAKVVEMQESLRERAEKAERELDYEQERNRLNVQQWSEENAKLQADLDARQQKWAEAVASLNVERLKNTGLQADLDALRATSAELDADRLRKHEELHRVKADLDAALNWIEHDEDESIPPAGLWQRVKALLEKRRVERG